MIVNRDALLWVNQGSSAKTERRIKSPTYMKDTFHGFLERWDSCAYRFVPDHLLFLS
jgi:hypothetical protein